MEMYWNMRNDQKCFPSCYAKNINSLTIAADGTRKLIVRCMYIYIYIYIYIYTTSGAVLFSGGSFTGSRKCVIPVVCVKLGEGM